MKKMIASPTAPKWSIIQIARKIADKIAERMTSENESQLTRILVRRLRDFAIRNFMFTDTRGLKEIRMEMDHDREFMGEMKFEDEWKKVQRSLCLRKAIQIIKQERDPEVRRNAIANAIKIANSLNLDIRKILNNKKPTTKKTEKPPVFGESLNIPMSAAVAA